MTLCFIALRPLVRTFFRISFSRRSDFLFIHIFLHIPCFNLRASIHASRKAGRHFVAMEVDQMIFKAILEPLIVASILEVIKKQCLDAQGASESLVDEEIADTVIEACNRFCK